MTEFWKNNLNCTLEVLRLKILKNSSQHNLPRIASTHIKFTQEMYQSITSQMTYSTCKSFLPKKIEDLSSWTSEVVSQVLTNGRRLGVAEWAGNRLQSG